MCKKANNNGEQLFNMKYPFQEVPEGVNQIAKPHREILDPPPNGNVRTMKFMHDSEQYYRSPANRVSWHKIGFIWLVQ